MNYRRPFYRNFLCYRNSSERCNDTNIDSYCYVFCYSYKTSIRLLYASNLFIELRLLFSSDPFYYRLLAERPGVVREIKLFCFYSECIQTNNFLYNFKNCMVRFDPKICALHALPSYFGLNLKYMKSEYNPKYGQKEKFTQIQDQI